MQLLNYFKDLTLHPKNAEELKGLILQLAVQGKLTQKWREENPDVEPASVLLERIGQEKFQLIREGKLKKEAELPEIENEDIIIDLPANWKCCRLGEVIEIIRGITFPSSEKSKTDGDGKIPCLRTANVQDKIEWEDLLYIDRSYVKREDRILRKGDVIMSMANSRELVGKVAIIDFEPTRDFTLGGFISALRTFGFNPSFLMVLLRSPKTRNELISSSSQTTNIANVSISKLRPLVIPFPPLAEQKSIVEIVNQLFAEVEQLEALTKERIQLKADFVTSALNQLTQASEQDVASHWEFLKSQFGIFFTEKENIKKLREAILQLAVQGKLTRAFRETHPELCEGSNSASALLERIKTEKEQLIKEKKIKKEKPLPPISEDEIPYDLPKGWVWCRMQDLIKDLRYGTSKKCDYGVGDSPVLRIPNVSNGKIDLEDLKSTYLSPKELKDLSLEKGDILLIRSNGSSGLVGRSTPVEEIGVGFSFAGYLVRVRLFQNGISNNYLHLVLESSETRKLIEGPLRTTSGVKNINSTEISRLPIPLPTLEEQKTIVEKVNGLMALCDQLEKEIETHQTTQEHWMQSCLREVFMFN